MVSGILGKSLRLAVMVITGLAALLLVAALLAWRLVDTGPIREQAAARLGEVLNKTVEIGQVSRFRLLWWPTVTFEDIVISREGHAVATIDRARVWVSLSSLLNGRPRPRVVHLQRPVLTIERLSPGVFNFYERGDPPRDRPPLVLNHLQVRDAQVRFRDLVTERGWRLEGCRLDLHDLRHPGGYLGQMLSGLETYGTLDCGMPGPAPAALSDLSVDIQAGDGVIELAPIEAIVLQGQSTGRFTADLSGEVPAFTFQYRLADMATATLAELLDGDHALLGEMTLDTALQAEGESLQAVRENLAGTLSLTADQLTLEGIDLDSALESYADTQSFNLVDVGAVFLAGPLGLLASRGFALGGLLEGNEGSTQIGRVVSDWQVENGVATARDVAFNTEENRLALTGSLDIGALQIEGVNVAVLDEDGCAVVEQGVTGPFNDPQITRPVVRALVTVIGPVLDLIQQGVEAVSDVECEVFYDGSVPHP